MRNASIYRAVKRLAWPGEAGVVVSVVHIKRGPSYQAVLDDRKVARISAYLVEGDYDAQPATIATNLNLAFQGSIPLGMGFTFDDSAAQKGVAESIKKMRELLASNPKNGERIFPYLGATKSRTIQGTFTTNSLSTLLKSHCLQPRLDGQSW